MQIYAQKEEIWAHSFDIPLCKTTCQYCKFEAEICRSLLGSLLLTSVDLSDSIFQTLLTVILWCQTVNQTVISLFLTLLKMNGSFVLLYVRTKSPKLRSLYSTYTVANFVLVSTFLYPEVATQMNVVFNFLGHSKIALNDFCVVISIP